MGLGSQGHKPSYTRWEPQDLHALHWGAGMGSEGRMLLWGWVGPASSGLVLLAQVVAPGGFPAQVPPWTTYRDLSTHHQSQDHP